MMSEQINLQTDRHGQRAEKKWNEIKIQKKSTAHGMVGMVQKHAKKRERAHTVAYLIFESKNRNSFEFGPV